MGQTLGVPFSVIDAACVGGAGHCGYAAEPIFVSDATTGAIVIFSVNQYGIRKPTAVIGGFAVNKKSGWSALGPSGLAFNTDKRGRCTQSTASTIRSSRSITQPNSSQPDEIVVLKGGKTFKCKYKKTTCGTLVHAGKPLDAPVAMTLLPNGNLIAANTQGGDMLVEMTPTGKILATKLVDKSKTGGIFGLRAVGKTDSDTVLYYTDRNDNSVHELKP